MSDSPEIIKLHLPRVDYTPEAVVSFIKACLDAEGLPMFKTKFITPFKVDAKPSVVGICYAGVEWKEPPSIVFVDVPKEDLELMKERVGEFRFLLEKYAPEKLKKLEEIL